MHNSFVRFGSLSDGPHHENPLALGWEMVNRSGPAINCLAKDTRLRTNGFFFARLTVRARQLMGLIVGRTHKILSLPRPGRPYSDTPGDGSLRLQVIREMGSCFTEINRHATGPQGISDPIIENAITDSWRKGYGFQCPTFLEHGVSYRRSF